MIVQHIPLQSVINPHVSIIQTMAKMKSGKENFKRLVVDSPVNVVLTNGEWDATGLHASIESEVADGTRTIRNRSGLSGACSNEDSPTVYIPFNPECTEFVANENAAIVLPSGGMFAPEIKLEAHAGQITSAAVNCYHLIVETGSGGQITLGGNAYIVTLKSTSGSQVHARNLVCSAFAGEANSGAKVEITVDKKIVARAFNGSITYYCIHELDKEITGQGAVEKRIELALK